MFWSNICLRPPGSRPCTVFLTLQLAPHLPAISASSSIIRLPEAGKPQRTAGSWRAEGAAELWTSASIHGPSTCPNHYRTSLSCLHSDKGETPSSASLSLSLSLSILPPFFMEAWRLPLKWQANRYFLSTKVGLAEGRLGRTSGKSRPVRSHRHPHPHRPHQMTLGVQALLGA